MIRVPGETSADWTKVSAGDGLASQRKKPAAIGVKASYPGFVEPAPATSIDRVPSGPRWIHEIKFDGYRVQVHIRDGKVRVFTRRGNDWSTRFRKIAAATSDHFPPAMV